jgi:hypothetical protein
VTAPPPVITPPIAQVAMPCGEVSFDATRPGSIDPVMLANAGHILLERVRAVYAEAGVPLPDRQLWTAGESAYDCEQLVVSLMSLTQPVFTPFNYDPGGGMEVESSLQVETAQGGMQAVSLTIRTVIG